MYSAATFAGTNSGLEQTANTEVTSQTKKDGVTRMTVSPPRRNFHSPNRSWSQPGISRRQWPAWGKFS